MSRIYKRLPQDEQGRVCTACEEYKTWDNFYKRSGTEYRQSRCKACMVETAREARFKRLSENVPCSTDECNEPVDIRGLCTYHYMRERYINSLERNQTVN